jgi:hypothetical protein
VSTFDLFSLAEAAIPNELNRPAHRQMIRVSGKDVLRVFGIPSAGQLSAHCSDCATEVSWRLHRSPARRLGP